MREVTVRLSSRDESGERHEPDAVAALDLPDGVSLVELCEAAVEAVRLRQAGVPTSPAAAIARVAAIAREVARRPGAARVAKVGAALLRQAGTALEEGHARVAASISATRR